jgi:hypothetical protein
MKVFEKWLENKIAETELATKSHITRGYSIHELRMLKEVQQEYQKFKKHTQPSLIRVNGIEVPAPLESLDGLDIAYLVDTSMFDSDGDKYAGVLEILINASDSNYVNKMLKAGLLYEKYDSAVKRYKAMVKFEVVE